MLKKKYIDACLFYASINQLDALFVVQALSYDVTVDAEIDVQELESQLLVNLPIEKRRLR